LKILPALRPIVGRTIEEARGKFDALQELLDPLVGLNRLNSSFGDLSGYPLDGPVPVDALGPTGIRSVSQQLREKVKREKPSIRQLYEQVAGLGGFCLIGTPKQIVDVMEDWFEGKACDGFNITPTHLPAGCEDFVDLITPELQQRGLFREEYEGKTLRENLGLKPPANRFARPHA
jgi:N-acetyl-S-(2-succino)cysteine monooxygenase